MFALVGFFCVNLIDDLTGDLILRCSCIVGGLNPIEGILLSCIINLLSLQLVRIGRMQNNKKILDSTTHPPYQFDAPAQVCLVIK